MNVEDYYVPTEINMHVAEDSEQELAYLLVFESDRGPVRIAVNAAGLEALRAAIQYVEGQQ